MNRKLAPLHPGEVLREEFMKPYGLTAYRLAALCQLPRTRIERIVDEEVGISADTALHLSKVFGTTPQFWLNLTDRYALEKAKAEPATAKKLASIRELEHAA
jgi:addiction module HigA family antidote